MVMLDMRIVGKHLGELQSTVGGVLENTCLVDTKIGVCA